MTIQLSDRASRLLAVVQERLTERIAAWAAEDFPGEKSSPGQTPEQAIFWALAVAARELDVDQTTLTQLTY